MQLAPNVTLYQSTQGYVFRAATGEHFAITMPDGDVNELIDVLAGDRRETSPKVGSALRALREAGHVIAADDPENIDVLGSGRVADALTELLRHSNFRSPERLRCAVSDDGLDSGVVADVSCFRDGVTSFIISRGVRAPDVSGRLLAARRHRAAIDDAHQPLAGGRQLTSRLHPMTPAAANVVAALIAARLHEYPALSASRHDYLVTAVDLRTCAISRHVVLPIPTAPQ